MFKINPSVTPGAIIGYRKNGMPIRLIAGGSGEGEEGNSSTGGQDGTGTGDSGQQDERDGSGNDVTGSDSQDSGTRDDRGRFAGRDNARDGGNDDDKTERTVAAIRQEFKDERTKRQAAEKKVADIQAALDADRAERKQQMDAMAIALGLKSGDEPPDPAKLAADLKAAQETAQAEISRRDSALRERSVELAVLRSAGKHGANGDALLDSRSFMDQAGKLDPLSDSFDGDLAEAIKDAVENGPQYKAAPAAGTGSGGQNGNGERKPPARSGGEHTAPGGQRQWTREEAAAVAKSDPQALQKAINDGLLTSLGYFPSSKR